MILYFWVTRERLKVEDGIYFRKSKPHAHLPVLFSLLQIALANKHTFVTCINTNGTANFETKIEWLVVTIVFYYF